ncbi:MAG: hypothetical protein ACJ8AK_03645 [Gemmatimonadaceae bacterium]
MTADRLPIALRAYAERTDVPHRGGSPLARKVWPQQILVFDTETTVDALQRLTFGSYRHLERGADGKATLLEEGLFYEDALPRSDPNGFAALRAYVKQHSELKLFSKSEFLGEVFYRVAYQARGLVVGFNLPFDLTRLAATWGEGREKFYGGFSLVLWQAWHPEREEWIEDPWRPRVLLNLVNSKMAFIEFGTPMELDPRDAVRDATQQVGARKRPWAFRGNFLDVRTLAFALTGESYSLEGACKAFNVEHGKTVAEEHGRITDAYIEYNRRDVLATSELLERLKLEFDTHPIALNPCKAYSPASIGKAYVRALGVTSPVVKFADIPRELHGIAMSAYYGGRAECHIRKVPLPVVHTDFISMYPTVFALLGMWALVTAKSISVERCTEEAQRQLDTASTDAYFQQHLWRDLNWFGEIEPDGDIVPVRAQYDPSSDALNIGVNQFSTSQPFWYAGPDLVASLLLTGKAPKIKRAIRLVANGRQDGLKEVLFSGSLPIDAATGDFIKNVIEERKRTQRGTALTREDRDRIARTLKLVANSTSYGIFAEVNQQVLPLDTEADVRIFASGKSFDAKTRRPETPGEFCFPPFAALVTAAARLMLAMLERTVTDAEGTFAFCDTDSMAIVATENGGSVAVPGATRRHQNGVRGVKALSWSAVNEIVQRFEALNPYERSVIPGSVLEIKDVNFDDERKQRQLYVYAIASKRYTFFAKNGEKKVQIIEPSEHGLGHLINPLTDGGPRQWIEVFWEYIVAGALGLRPVRPSFLHVPALTRITVSSPHILRPFAQQEKELPFNERTSPTVFLLSASIAPNGHPVGADPERFHLLAPYQRDSTKWLEMKWTELHSAHDYPVTTEFPAPPYVAQVRSFADVLTDFVMRPEPKSASSSGELCERKTLGLLQRRDVRVASIHCVGKETNRLEPVQQGLVHDWSEVYTLYRNPELDAWRNDILPGLKRIRRKALSEATGITRRAIRSILNGYSLPSPRTRERLIATLETQASPSIATGGNRPL